MAAVSNLQTPTFFSRIYDYPLVNSACSQVFTYYARAKDQPGMISSGLSFAESGVKKIAEGTVPALTRLERPIGRLDQLVCQQLDRLESNYPLIQQPTEDVLVQSRKFYNAKLRSKVDLILTPVTIAVNTINAAKERTNDVCDYGYAQTKNINKRANDGVVRLLNCADSAVDRLLPTDEIEPAMESCGTVDQATHLTNKVRKRLYKRVLRDIKVVSSYGQDVISYASAHIDSSKHLANAVKKEYLAKLSALKSHDAEHLHKMQIKEGHLLATVHLYAEHLRSVALASTEIAYAQLPIPIQTSLQATRVHLLAAYNRVIATTRLSDYTSSLHEEVQQQLNAAYVALKNLASQFPDMPFRNHSEKSVDDIELSYITKL